MSHAPHEPAERLESPSLMKAVARYGLLPLLLLLTDCSERAFEETDYKTSGLPSLEGSPSYLSSPFVTTGDRVYMVGHQDGTFPDLGWHIEGEMGGIWDHPVKLMDGFAASLKLKGDDRVHCLNEAEKFVNYPFGNSHYFNWEEAGISVERFQFVPDGIEGIIVEFRITNSASEAKDITFSFTGMVDLRPTWLGERTDMIDAEDAVDFDESLSAVIAHDSRNPWYVVFGSSVKGEFSSDTTNACFGSTRRGYGKNATLNFDVALGANQQQVVPVYIAGSYHSEEIARENYENLRVKTSSLLKDKITLFKKIDSRSHLIIPDKDVEEMYEWLKYNVQWLVRDVPEQGAGVSAGLPDYPWWFGADMTYTLQGVLATGDHELARNSLNLLRNISRRENGNGRIVHEVSTNGSVYNPGNVNETAQFITVLYTYLAWTGDKELIEEFFPDVIKGIEWLLKDSDPDGNGYPNGSGMMEIPGLDSEMIDVAVYTQQALTSAAAMARVVGEGELAAAYERSAEALKSRINEEWWSPEDESFGDFRGTAPEAEAILEAALIRADTLLKPWAVAELRETQKRLREYPSDESIPHVIYHNWVVNTPMETGIADPEKAEKALKTAVRYENPFGVFVTGIDRTEESDSMVLKARKKVFSYTGAVMTLPTGVQAVAAARYQPPEDALEYLHKLRRSFSYALPGSMYEVSPDFGMVTQAWNIYGVAVPLVNHFFGIQPRAHEQTIDILPRLPGAWNEALLENVRVGNNSLRLAIYRKDDHLEYHIQQALPDWNLRVFVGQVENVVHNGINKGLPTDEWLQVQGKEHVVKIYWRNP